MSRRSMALSSALALPHLDPQMLAFCPCPPAQRSLAWDFIEDSSKPKIAHDVRDLHLISQRSGHALKGVIGDTRLASFVSQKPRAVQTGPKHKKPTEFWRAFHVLLKKVYSVLSAANIVLYTMPPRAPPMSGAIQKSQSCTSAQPPTKTAGPVLRAGLTLRFVTGIPMR